MILGVAAAAVLAAGPAVAQSEVADQTMTAPAELDPETRAFIIGNAIFVVFHEFGHVLIRDFDVPILGLEENSADTLAAITLILADRAEPEREPRLSEFLAMSALGNILLWQTGLEKSNEEVLYWAKHDVSIRRAARMLCLLYGSDTEEFGWVLVRGRVRHRGPGGELGSGDLRRARGHGRQTGIAADHDSLSPAAQRTAAVHHGAAPGMASDRGSRRLYQSPLRAAG
jgi:hypothetical protein